MKAILILTMIATIAAAQQAAQTPEQIQQQKNAANQAVIAGVADDSKSPLKLFEAYYSGLIACDSTQFRCLTQQAIKDWLEVDALTAADLKRMSDGQKSLDKKDFVLVEFSYKADANRPEIVFGYRYNYKDGDGQRITTVEREKLILTRTADGWKIDALDSDPAP